MWARSFIQYPGQGVLFNNPGKEFYSINWVLYLGEEVYSITPGKEFLFDKLGFIVYLGKEYSVTPGKEYYSITPGKEFYSVTPGKFYSITPGKEFYSVTPGKEVGLITQARNGDWCKNQRKSGVRGWEFVLSKIAQASFMVNHYTHWYI